MVIDRLRALIPIRRFREAPPTVAVLRLHGVIMAHGSHLRPGLGLAGLAGPIEQAFKTRGLKAVALSVNSPGGSPVQSALIHDRIRALAEEKEIPVITFVEDVAASGGYWLALAGDEVYVNESSILGSIGVVSAGFGFQDLLAKIGVERRLHTSGDKKSFLDPFVDEKAADVKRLTVIQKDIHESFKKQVRGRREGKLKGAERTLFSGEFWTGPKAVELGLADGVGDLRGILRERYGEKVRLKVVERRKGVLQRRLGLESSSQSMPASLVDGVVEALGARALWGRYGL
jgi:signal peptide peptidase SppA